MHSFYCASSFSCPPCRVHSQNHWHPRGPELHPQSACRAAHNASANIKAVSSPSAYPDSTSQYLPNVLVPLGSSTLLLGNHVIAEDCFMLSMHQDAHVHDRQRSLVLLLLHLHCQLPVCIGRSSLGLWCSSSLTGGRSCFSTEQQPRLKLWQGVGAVHGDFVVLVRAQLLQLKGTIS